MTRLTTTLLYTVFFLVCVHFLECNTKEEDEMKSDLPVFKNRRNTFGYIPDLADYFVSYNRLLNRGNLNNRRPLTVRRGMDDKNPKDKRVDKIIKPILDNVTEDQKKPMERILRCLVACPRKESPICATNFKTTEEFRNVCEYRKQTRCSKKLGDGWKILNLGRCPKTIRGEKGNWRQ